MNVAPLDSPNTGIATMVARLELERYRATVKGLTRFGDRRQGTDRNRAAVDWIEAQLNSYGCTPTARITYDYKEPPPRGPRPPMDSAARARLERNAVGGGRNRGKRTPTGVNTDSTLQPDAKLRALDTPQSVDGERQEVYCTKVGTTHPDEMYIVGGHMDGIGWGEAANDDGSGTALVMELARVFSSPDVHTDRSIRFILWNNEETGLDGAKAYVAQRQALQGIESPKGSGKYPEPKWLGMVQHDMMMFDHGMPNADGTMNKEQRPEADVNIEFQSKSKFADGCGEARVGVRGCEREVRHRLSRAGWAAHDEHGLVAIHGRGPRDQPARERARRADRERLGSAVAPANGSLRHLHRQGLPARTQRRADDAERDRDADGRAAHDARPLESTSI